MAIRPAAGEPASDTGLRAVAKVAGFELHAYSHSAGHRLPWHVHDRAVVVLLRSGGYTQYGPRCSFDCAAGEMAIVPAEERNRETIGAGGASSLLIFLESDRARQVDEKSDLLAGVRHFDGLAVSRLTESLARELVSPDDVTPLAAEAASLELVSWAARRHRSMGGGAPPGWLLSARQLIRDRHAEPLSLGDIAAAVGISRSQLARGFRAWWATSPALYQRLVRLRSAARRLRETDDPIADIALDTGFCDQSHLTNAFRRVFDISPARYRRGWGDLNRPAGLPGDRRGRLGGSAADRPRARR